MTAVKWGLIGIPVLAALVVLVGGNAGVGPAEITVATVIVLVWVVLLAVFLVRRKP